MIDSLVITECQRGVHCAVLWLVYAMCRCCGWIPGWEVDHYVCCHVLSLLLQDEGWVCAGTQSWQGLSVSLSVFSLLLFR